METATVLSALLDAKNSLRKKVQVLRAFLHSQKNHDATAPAGPGQGRHPGLQLLAAEASKRGSVAALRGVLARIQQQVTPRKGARAVAPKASEADGPKRSTRGNNLLILLAGEDKARETALDVIKSQGLRVAPLLLSGLVRALDLLESAPPDSKEAGQTPGRTPPPRPGERERAVALRIQIPDAIKELSRNCNVAELVRILDGCRHPEARRIAFQALGRYRPYPQEIEVICAQLARLRPSPELNDLIDKWTQAAR